MAGSGGGDGAAAAGPGAGPRQEAAGGREGRPGRRAEAALAGPHLRGEGVAARRGGSSASPRFCHSPLPPPFIPRPLFLALSPRLPFAAPQEAALKRCPALASTGGPGRPRGPSAPVWGGAAGLRWSRLSGAG